MSISFTITLLAILALVVWLRPSVDRTRHGALLLWFGRKRRRYIVLQHRH